jgi:hypothetical protein
MESWRHGRYSAAAIAERREARATLRLLRELLRNAYALIVFLIGTAAIGAMSALGLTLFNLAGPIGNALN